MESANSLMLARDSSMMKRVFLCVMAGGTLGFLAARMIPLLSEKVAMKRDALGYINVQTVEDVCAVYPKTVEEIKQRVQAVQGKAQTIIANIIACPSSEQTIETMLRAYDQLFAYVRVEWSLLELVKSVYPDVNIREEAEKQYITLDAFWTEHIESNLALYKAFKTYAQGNAKTQNLSPEDVYLLKGIMEDFERAGLSLSDADRARVLELKKRCSEIESEYLRRIEVDGVKLKVSKDELAGIDEDFIASLPKEGDLYVLALNYPNQTMVMSYCSVEETRKGYLKAFKNRAYPENEVLLQELVAKRDELAKLLGFESFAHYNVADQMIKTPARAWEFENSLLPRALEKSKKEFAELVEDLPAGVSLTTDGKLESWNFGYVSTHFKKKKYSIDERKFAEYFPMQKTVDGLISIYETFFSLTIEQVPVTGLWHEDVELLKVSNKDDGKVRGYIFLDMFPRDNKYGHAAQFDGIRSLKKEDGSFYPCVVTVVCNFTKPLGDKPSLLKYGEVTTFFHEFGHAIHSVLGGTKYAIQAGTNTEIDFVELPSQMLEEWMEDKGILKMISSHYQTGEPLPDDLIEKRIELQKYGTGMFVTSQLSLGMVSLSFFGEGATKDVARIFKEYNELCCPYVPYHDDEHRYCSFGHLMQYASRYYGYLWSLVLAEDVFETIQEHGLLNPEIGKKYADAILCKGGSKDANDMLRDFLGREPNYDAFYRKMGF